VKVVGFVGSPRVGGNTATLVAEVLRGAASAGAETELVALNKLKIAPCQACDVCRKLKRCHVRDDMQPLYAKFLNADAIVLGTPIYWWGPSAQLKAFIDRWYAIAQEGIQEKLAGKRSLLVCAFGDNDLATSDATVSCVRSAVEWLDMRFAEPLLGPGLGEPGEAAQDAALMRRAYEAGVALGER
jgi:multimeric flavodoxin WrbA